MLYCYYHLISKKYNLKKKMITTRESINYQYSLIFGYHSPNESNISVGDIISPGMLSEGLIKVIRVVILRIYFLEKKVAYEIIKLIIEEAVVHMIVKFFWGEIVDYFIKYGRKKFIIIGGLI